MPTRVDLATAAQLATLQAQVDAQAAQIAALQGGGASPLAGVIQLADFYTGNWDDAIVAAHTYIQAQPFMPYLQFPAGAITLNRSVTMFSGMKWLPPNAPSNSPKNPELASGQYMNHWITVGPSVTTGNASLLVGSGTLYDVYIGPMAFKNNRTAQFCHMPAGGSGLYSCCFDGLSLYGFKYAFGNPSSACTMTWSTFTGDWTVNAWYEQQFTLAGSDCKFWMNGRANIQGGIDPANTSPWSVVFQSMNKTNVGGAYITCNKGVRGILVTGSASTSNPPNTGLNFWGTIIEGYKATDDAANSRYTCFGSLYRQDLGEVLMIGAELNHAMTNPTAFGDTNNGVMDIRGGGFKLIAPSYRRASTVNDSVTAFLSSTGGTAHAQWGRRGLAASGAEQRLPYHAAGGTVTADTTTFVSIEETDVALTTNNCEGPSGVVDGDNVVAGTSGGAAGTAFFAIDPNNGTIKYTNDAYYRGHFAIKILPGASPGVTPACAVSVGLESGGTNSGALTMMFKLGSLPAATTRFTDVISSALNVRAAVCLDSTGHLVPQGAGAPITGSASTGALAAGIWYRLEWHWTNEATGAAGTNDAVVYLGDTTLVVAEYHLTAQSNGSSGAVRLRIGEVSSISAWTSGVIIDDIAYASATTTQPVLSIPPPDAYYVAQRASLANVTATTTSVLTLAAGASIAVNDYLLMRIAVDNSGTSGAAPGITDLTGIVDTATGGSNTWHVLGPANQDPGAANAGITCYIAYAKVAHTYTDGATITITWLSSPGPAAKSIDVSQWTNIDLTTPLGGIAVVTATGSSNAPLVSITPTASGQLVFAAFAIAGPAGEGFILDTDTTDGSWAALQAVATTDGTAANNALLRGAVKRVSGTTGAQAFGGSGPPTTISTSRDWATVAIVLAPVAPPVSVQLDTPTGLTVNTSATPISAVATWNPVAHAVNYQTVLQTLNPGGDPLVDGDWTTASGGTKTVSGTSSTYLVDDGITYSDEVRVKVKALAE